MSHITGEVTTFRKELIKAEFVVEEMNKNSNAHWRVYRTGQPFYTFHPSKKGIMPCKDWIWRTYKVDLRNRPKKNLTKREKRANIVNELQEAQQRAKMMDNRFTDLALWLKQTHRETYNEFMERYE